MILIKGVKITPLLVLVYIPFAIFVISFFEVIAEIRSSAVLVMQFKKFTLGG